jgi:hypothetical protein
MAEEAMTTLEHRVEVLEKKDRTRALLARLQELRADGYTGSIHNPNDAATIHLAHCENCGRKGLKYFGLLRLRPWSYAAFHECRRCGTWGEF